MRPIEKAAFGELTLPSRTAIDDFDASIKIKRARPKTRWSFSQIRAAVVRVSP